MRVISGRARGKKLEAPEGLNTRPITDQIKEALFSMWQNRIVDCTFADFFAGSGSMGIEALSRGAKHVVFVEKGSEAISVIQRNLKGCHFTDGYDLYQADVFDQIERLKKEGIVFDIIYLDPPFTVDEIFLPVMEALSDGCLLADDGIIAIRTKKQKQMPEDMGCLHKYRFKKYGISGMHFYEKR